MAYQPITSQQLNAGNFLLQQTHHRNDHNSSSKHHAKTQSHTQLRSQMIHNITNGTVFVEVRVEVGKSLR